MRRAYVALLVIACGSAPAPSDPSKVDWARDCAARIEAARAMVPAVAHGTLKVDASPWNPAVRFEAHAGRGYWEAAVSHGQNPCIDFDTDDPSATNLPWTDSKRVALDRIRRANGDEAWVQADGVPRETLEPFRVAFERALDACLADARAVPLGRVPNDYSCLDKVDTCPDDGGCP